MYLVRCGHFRSRDKDGGHTILSATALQKPHNACKLHGSIFYRNCLMPIKVLHCGYREFRAFLLMWPWPWSYDLHIRTLPYLPKMTSQRPKINFLRQGFPKLSYCRQTDRQTPPKTSRRLAGDNKSIVHKSICSYPQSFLAFLAYLFCSNYRCMQNDAIITLSWSHIRE